jgi:glycosyltransferase involved in cell wall biosynthesis
MIKARNTSMNIFIFVDNFKIGGFQRLSLDQAYGFAHAGHRVTLIGLSAFPSPQIPNFISAETYLIRELGITLKSCPGGRIKQALFIRKLLKAAQGNLLIISHSLRATVILAVIRISSSLRFQIHTTIHQIPSLSHLAQRKRRFLYAQFTDFLYGYSNAVIIDWKNREKHESLLAKLRIRKNIHLLRNGVFLPRIPEFPSLKGGDEIPRLIYIGRSTHWKGISEFLIITKDSRLIDFNILILMPEIDNSIMEQLDDESRKRYQLLEGKTVADIVRIPGDVHIYPTNYGNSVNLIEGVSLNCIEMACMGIPSLISANGLSTWPEPFLKDLFVETEWVNQEITITKILRTSTLSKGISKARIDLVRELFSIDNQLNTYMSDKV